MMDGSYKQVSAGEKHTVLLSTDGRVEFFPEEAGEEFDAYATYAQVSAAGDRRSVLLTDDGKVVDRGIEEHMNPEQVELLRLVKDEATFVQVSAGTLHTVALTKDGRAVAYGSNSEGQCNLRPWEEDFFVRESCTFVSAGPLHTVLVTTEGKAIAVGSNAGHQCEIPTLGEGTLYTAVSAGNHHTVLLRSDGQVATAGSNASGQCDIPKLGCGFRYVHVSAGGHHTVLIRNDGAAVAVGANDNGQCELMQEVFGSQSWSHWVLSKPLLKPGVKYVEGLPAPVICEVQEVHVVVIIIEELSADLHIEEISADLHIECLCLADTLLASFDVPSSTTVEGFKVRLHDELSRRSFRSSHKVVLPNGRLLDPCPGHELFMMACADFSLVSAPQLAILDQRSYAVDVCERSSDSIQYLDDSATSSPKNSEPEVEELSSSNNSEPEVEDSL